MCKIIFVIAWQVDDVTCFRDPVDDVTVWWGQRVRVHPVSPSDRPLSLLRAVPRRRLHAGSVPPSAVREAADPEDQCGPPGPAEDQGQGHSEGVQHGPVRVVIQA